jgi:hypothetical protein
MKHLSEEQLVSAFYGEHSREHLAECEECRSAYERMEAALAQVDALEPPERSEVYGREVWARIQPKLDQRPRWEWLWGWRRWAAAAAMTTLIVAAFFAGRFWPAQQHTKAAQGIAAQTRERVLMVALGDHLDRSQMVLLELVNARSADEVDITAEQRRADDLVATNRLYRQTAAGAGEAGLASVLEDLERALLDIARSPSKLSSREFEELRRRIEAQGIVFKVRVIDSDLQTRSSAS